MAKTHPSALDGLLDGPDAFAAGDNLEGVRNTVLACGRMNGRPVTSRRSDRRSPLSWPYLMSAKWPDISLEWGANAELWRKGTDFPKRQSARGLRQFSATILATIIHT